MKQKNILFIFLVILSAVFSCERVDESQLEGNESAAEKVQMTFKAVIDGEGAQTKTVLGGDLGDDLRKVFWQPGDEIGVSTEKAEVYWDDYLSEVSKFTTDVTSRSESSMFTGSVEIGTRYKAFYPYHPETLRDSANIFIFNLPNEQKYVNGSFDPDAAPMVASANAGETFSFRNLCGILAIQLKGEGAVTSIVFNGNDADGNPWMVAGEYEVNPIAEGTPEIRYHGKGHKSVTLTCDEPVQLNPEIATPFYMVLPPATYSSFTVMVTTDDGTFMIQEGVKPLTVKRADIVAAGALTYVETLPIDLSEHGTANSYIVPGAGLYSFDVGTIGNGTYGLIPDIVFHTIDPTINPAAVEILWQDADDLIDTGSISYDSVNKKIRFMSKGTEGNALVAVKDESENILWSWHLWVTDQPQEQTYINELGKYVMLDRNLGATRADRGTGDEYRESVGLFYQWGRKDPFAKDRYTTASRQLSIEESIMNPMILASASNPWSTDWNKQLWDTAQKTIYDPCPVGYKVPTINVWSGFSLTGKSVNNVSEMNVSGGFDYGWNFIYDGTNTTWYPAGGELDYWGTYVTWSDRGRLWAAETDGGSRVLYLDYYYYSNWDASLHFTDNYHDSFYGNAVRCMKDENHVDIAYPKLAVTEISDVTTDSAVIHASVSDDNASSSISERGIIWGTESGLTLEKGNVIPEATGLNEYSVSLTGLTNATKYYVRAYATNERGTGYSDEVSFYTAFSGEPVNLSSNGTANSYIVRPIYGEYYFDASVKGNSEESVGQIASVELLWETRNTANNIKAGSVVTSAELKGTDVHFQLPPDVKPGNAVIAVKDALGTILWSWHIWVVDFDPVETQQTYKSGAIMMDRNLGATSAVPGSFGSYGLYYQWGRKDPFVIPGYMTTVPAGAISYQYVDWSNNTIEHAVKNPTVVYDDASWNGVVDLWNSSKTKYDPCPVGWRIPENSALQGINAATVNNAGYYEVAATPNANIPLAGRTNGTDYVETYNSEGFLWITEPGTIRGFQHWNWGTFDNYIGVDGLTSVRCMKDMSGVSGGGNDYVVDDEYEWE